MDYPTGVACPSLHHCFPTRRLYVIESLTPTHRSKASYHSISAVLEQQLWTTVEQCCSDAYGRPYDSSTPIRIFTSLFYALVKRSLLFMTSETHLVQDTVCYNSCLLSLRSSTNTAVYGLYVVPPKNTLSSSSCCFRFVGTRAGGSVVRRLGSGCPLAGVRADHDHHRHRRGYVY